jgi:hypothetical protein
MNTYYRRTRGRYTQAAAFKNDNALPAAPYKDLECPAPGLGDRVLERPPIKTLCTPERWAICVDQ